VYALTVLEPPPNGQVDLLGLVTVRGTLGVVAGERDWALGVPMTLIPQAGGLITFVAVEGSSGRAVYAVEGRQLDE
jgi:hypothetical protein